MGKITIAIDGYSSCGKSTVAKEIAKILNYNYVDSGAMYRAVTFYLIQKGIIKDGAYLLDAVLKELNLIDIEFIFNPEKNISETYLNGENIENKIRSIDVSKQVSQVSVIEEVRKKLVSIQQEMGKKGGVVMDGRDIGTIVFPFAEVKLFMTADIDVRTERRYNELIAKGDQVNYDEVKKNLSQRDYIDTTREISPLRQADDAIVIDNSELTKENQLELIMEIIQNKIKLKSKLKENKIS